MQDKQNKKLEIQLWDLVKNSTKKLKANNNYSSRPKKVVQNLLSDSNQHTPNATNISSKKENLKIPDVEVTNFTLNFINEKNNGGIRNKDLRNLRSGKITIQSKLDLHGYKLHDAEKKFNNFIINSYEQCDRNLLIITGKGQDGEGKIRKSLHRWINKNELSKLVIYYTHASPKDGGLGAYYVRLRKNSK